MLSATAAKSISEVKPSNKRGAHQNIVFGYRLVVKQAKSGQGVSGHANKLAHIRMLPDAQSQQAEVRAFYDMLYNRQKPECFSKCDSLGTSQGRRAIRLRSPDLA